MTKMLTFVAVAAAIVPVAAIGVAQGAAATAQAGEATMSSPTLRVRTTQFGKALFAGNGRVVYAFTRDYSRHSFSCKSACCRRW